MNTSKNSNEFVHDLHVIDVYDSDDDGSEDQVKIDNKKKQEELALFQRSSKMHRSPLSAKKEAPRQQSMSESEPQSPTELYTTPAPAVVPIRVLAPGQESFHKLGEQIKSLVELTRDVKKRHIVRAVRDAIDSIKALYELTAIQQRDEKAKEVIRRENYSQTTPGLTSLAPGKRKHTPNSEIPDPKRRQKIKATTKPKMKNIEDIQSPVSKTAPTNVVNRKENDDGGKGWTKVTKKKATKKSQEPSKVKSKPDAILIEKKGDTSYAEILRSVKNDPKMEAIGKAVSRIRRTQKGELLFQLNHTEVNAAEFQKTISEALGTRAEVKALAQRMTIECKDIDEITTKEDISAAIGAQFGNEPIPLEAISLRKAYGETQTATISLPTERARKLLEAGRIKIGWVLCRIREKATITKCFKCLEFGHVAKYCKSEVDRSDLCRRCGSEGHIAKNCNKEPSCMFCRNDQTKDASHIAGSNRCPMLKMAINSRGKRVEKIPDSGDKKASGNRKNKQ